MKTIQVLLAVDMQVPDELVGAVNKDAEDYDGIQAKKQLDAIIRKTVQNLAGLATGKCVATVCRMQRATKATLVRHDPICLRIGITDYQPPVLLGPFVVQEWASGFEVLHLASGDTHWMSDGVDVLSDENDEALSPGTPGFREYWEHVLNVSAEETLEAYFPQHVEKDDESSP